MNCYVDTGFNPCNFRTVSRPIYSPSLPLKLEWTVGFVCLNVKGTQDFLNVILKKKPFVKQSTKTWI